MGCFVSAASKGLRRIGMKQITGAAGQKKRNAFGSRGVHTPIKMDEYQKKGVAGGACCKRLKIRRLHDGKNGVYSVDSVARR
jgi:hypothetical protein